MTEWMNESKKEQHLRDDFTQNVVAKCVHENAWKVYVTIRIKERQKKK